MSEIPADLYYTTEHEWVQRTGDDTVRVGITDYAQSALGDVVFVQLPDVGTAVSAGDSFGETALIDEGPRSATIVAATDLRCLALSAWDFRPFVEEHPPVAWALLRALVQRLRQAQD